MAYTQSRKGDIRPKARNAPPGKKGERVKDLRPTPRQIMAARHLVEKGGSVRAAMREAGYSENTSRTPQKLTKTKTWQRLMDEYLPAEDIAKLHKELCNAAAIQNYEFPKPERAKGDKKDEKDGRESIDGLSDDEIKAIVESVPGCRLIYIKDTIWGRTAYFQAPDSRVRDSALDKAYKLRGSYAAEKHEITDPLESLTNSDLARKIAKMRAFLQKKPIPKN